MDRLNQLRQPASDNASESLLDNSVASNDSNLDYQTANESNSSKFFSFIEDDSPSMKGILEGSDSNETLIGSEKIVEDIQEDILSNLPSIAKKPDLLSYKIDNQIDAANILSGGDFVIFDENENSYDENELIIDDNPSLLAENQLDDNKNLEDSSIENLKSGLLTKKTGEENIACKSTLTAEDVLKDTLNKGSEASLCPEPSVVTAEFANNPDVQTSTNEIILQIDGKNLNAIDIGNGLFLYRKEGEEELTAIQITPSDDGSPQIKFLKVRHNEDDNLEVYEEQITEVPIINEKIEKEPMVSSDEVIVEPKTSHLPIKDLNKVIGCADTMAGSKTVALEKRPNTSSLDKIIVLPDEFDGKRDKKQVNELESSFKDPKSHVSDKTEHIFATGLKMNDLNFTKSSQLAKAKADIGIIAKTDMFKVEKSTTESNVKISVSTEVNKKLPSVWASSPAADQCKFKTLLDVKDKESSIFELCKKKSLETDLDKDIIQESFFDSLNDSVDLEESALKSKISRSTNILDCCIEKVKVLSVSPLRLPAPLMSISPIDKTEKLHRKAKTNKVGNICGMESFIPKLTPSIDSIENILDQLPTKEPKVCTEPVSKSISDFKHNEKSYVSSDMVIQQSEGEICNVNIHSENAIPRSTVTIKEKHREASNIIVGNELSTIFVTGQLDIDEEFSGVTIKSIDKIALNKDNGSNLKTKESNLKPVSNSDKHEKMSEVVKKLSKSDKVEEDIKVHKAKYPTILPIEQSDKAPLNNKNEENLPRACDNDDVILVQELCANSSKPESCRLPIKSDVGIERETKDFKFNQLENKEVNKASKDIYNTEIISEIIQLAETTSVNYSSKPLAVDTDKIIDLTDDTHITESEVCTDLRNDTTLNTQKCIEKPDKKIENAILKLNKMAESKPSAVKKLVNPKQDIAFKYNFGKIRHSKIVKAPEDSSQIVNLSLEKPNLEYPLSFNKKETIPTKKSESKLERLLRPETALNVTLDSNTKNKTNDNNNHESEKANSSKISYCQKVPELGLTKFTGPSIKETVGIDLIKTSKEKAKSNPPLQSSINEIKPIGTQSSMPLTKKVDSLKIVKEVISKAPEKQPELTGNDEDKFVYDDNYISEALNMKSISADADYNEFTTHTNIIPSTTLSQLKDPFAEERKINNKKQEITDVYKNLTGSKYPSKIPGKISSHTGIGKDFRKTQPSNWYASANKLNIPRPAPIDMFIGNKTIQNKKMEEIIEDKVAKPIIESEVIVLDDDSERYSEEEVLECEPVTGDVDFKWLQSVTDVTKEKSNMQRRIEPPRNDSPVKLSNYETKSKKVIVETTELGKELNVDANNLSRVGAKIVDTPSRTELDDKNANAVITEVDFDKFVRRNSTHRYEDCIAVELQNEKPNIVHRIIESDLQDLNKLQTETRVPNNILIPNDVNKQGKLNSVQNITQNNTFSMKCAKKVYPGRKSNLTEESGRAQGVTPDKNIAANSLLYSQLNQNSSGVHKMSHPNKFQKAYQSALSTKIRNNLNHISASIEQPITVVITDPTTEDLISVVGGSKPSSQQCTKQGNSIAKETITKLATHTDDNLIKESSSSNPPCESIPPQSDDDKLGTVQRQKTKQPRKQVLSPVESSDIEIIFSNSGMDDSSKGSKQRKRKPDYLSPKLLPEISPDKAPKEDEKLSNILPKKKILARASAFSESNIEKYVSLNKTAIDSEKTDGIGNSVPKKGRGRPRKSLIPIDSSHQDLKDNTAEIKSNISGSPIQEGGIVKDANMIRENWTMGKINENMRCPICSKIFRSENVVFKHVKHCSGISLEKEDGELDSDNVYHDESMTEQSTAMKNATITPEKVDKHDFDQKDNGNEEPSIEYDNKILVNTDALKKPKSKLEKITTYAKSLKHPSHDDNVNLSCEMCGKTFRQLSYLISHKLTHTENEVKSEPVRTESEAASALSCEICKKSFRKLYHLVQHREMHHTPKSMFEKRSKHDDVKPEEIITEKKEIILTIPPDTLTVEEKSVKTSQDQKTVGFRCEACDKSFRKLHHLVEHRETHDGAGRLNMPLSPLATGPNLPLPKCDICSKTFRKLHLMIEHKKHHSTISEDESSESAIDNLPRLLAKDIIHECSICYMVFPNEHSLNKHSASCLRKRNSKGVRLSTDNVSISETEQKDSDGEEDPSENQIIVRSSPVKRSISNDNATTTQPVVPKKIHKPIETLSQLTPKINVNKSRISRRLNSNPPPVTKVNHSEVKDDEIRYKINPLYKPKSDLDSDDRSTSGDSDNVPLKNIPKMPLVNTSRRRTIATKKVLAKSELKSKETETKQTPKLKLTQGLIVKKSPKISKYKEKQILRTVSSIVNRIKSVESNIDDDSIKYSFPKKLKNPTTVKKRETKKLPVNSTASSSTVRSQLRKLKSPTKTKKDKGETLSGVKKVKTPSKAVPLKLTLKCCGHSFSSQATLAEHRKDHKKLPLHLTHLCDCGEVFSSAALLARHTTLSHTPPRIRRSRLFSAVSVAKGPKQNVSTKESGAVVKSVKKKVTHSGVPVPESTRRALVSDKL